MSTVWRKNIESLNVELDAPEKNKTKEDCEILSKLSKVRAIEDMGNIL